MCVSEVVITMLTLLKLQPKNFSYSEDIDILHDELLQNISQISNEELQTEICLILENDELFTSYEFQKVEIVETSINLLVILDNHVLADHIFVTRK